MKRRAILGVLAAGVGGVGGCIGGNNGETANDYHDVSESCVEPEADELTDAFPSTVENWNLDVPGTGTGAGPYEYRFRTYKEESGEGSAILVIFQWDSTDDIDEDDLLVDGFLHQQTDLHSYNVYGVTGRHGYLASTDRNFDQSRALVKQLETVDEQCASALATHELE